MRFDYDLDADALYVTLTGGPVAATREVEPLTMVDVDAEERPVGIEVIDPNRGWPLDLVLARYPLPEHETQMLRALYSCGFGGADP